MVNLHAALIIPPQSPQSCQSRSHCLLTRMSLPHSQNMIRAVHEDSRSIPLPLGLRDGLLPILGSNGVEKRMLGRFGQMDNGVKTNILRITFLPKIHPFSPKYGKLFVWGGKFLSVNASLGSNNRLQRTKQTVMCCSPPSASSAAASAQLLLTKLQTQAKHFRCPEWAALPTKGMSPRPQHFHF